MKRLLGNVIRVLGWADYAQGDTYTQQALIDWKVDRFQKVGWGGVNIAKWRGTASTEFALNDEAVPLGCLSTVNNAVAGVAFLIDNDLENYPVDGDIVGEFVGAPVSGEVANPWFAGELVDESYQGTKRAPGETDKDRLGLGRKQEQWIVQQATSLAERGLWPYPHRRIWLFTEREPLDFLPEMYERWGWKTHRSFFYDGLQRWVMYKDF